MHPHVAASALHLCQRFGVRNRWLIGKLMHKYTRATQSLMQWFYFIHPPMFSGAPSELRGCELYPYTDRVKQLRALTYFLNYRRRFPVRVTVIGEDSPDAEVVARFEVKFVDCPISNRSHGDAPFIVTPLALAALAADPVTVLLLLRHGARPTVDYLWALNQTRAQPLVIVVRQLNYQHRCWMQHVRLQTLLRQAEEERQQASTLNRYGLHHQNNHSLRHLPTADDRDVDPNETEPLRDQQHVENTQNNEQQEDIHINVDSSDSNTSQKPFDADLLRRLQLCLKYLGRTVPRLPVCLTDDVTSLTPVFFSKLTVSDNLPLHSSFASCLPPHCVHRYPAPLQHLCRCRVRTLLLEANQLPKGIGKLSVHTMLKSYLDLCFE